MSAKINLEDYATKIDALGLVPGKDRLTAIVDRWIADGVDGLDRLDADVSPIMVEALRHNYAKIYETQYGDLKFAAGLVAGFDTSPDPADDSYKYETMDYSGYADWVGDDGTVMGEGAMTMKAHLGFMAYVGHRFSFTTMDLARAAKDGRGLPATRQRLSFRFHEAKHNWVFAFGDPEKHLHGAFTHPNIQVVLAPVNAAGTYGDNRDRLIETKTVAEILADVETAVETVPRTTKQMHRTAKVFMPYRDISHMKNRLVGDSNGTLTVWQVVQSLYPDVSFEVLNECNDADRLNPRTNTNSSGISGQCWLCMPDLPADECGFVFPQPFKQNAPQLVDLKVNTITLSKIGGFKCIYPLAVVRVDFLAADVSTAAP